jgi:hypothetical protein
VWGCVAHAPGSPEVAGFALRKAEVPSKVLLEDLTALLRAWAVGRESIEVRRMASARAASAVGRQAEEEAQLRTARTALHGAAGRVLDVLRDPRLAELKAGPYAALAGPLAELRGAAGLVQATIERVAPSTGPAAAASAAAPSSTRVRPDRRRAAWSDRRAQRYVVDAHVTVTVDGVAAPSRVCEISATGALHTLERALATGTRVTLRYSENPALVVHGAAVACEPAPVEAGRAEGTAHDAAIAFDPLAEPDARTLKLVIARMLLAGIERG